MKKTIINCLLGVLLCQAHAFAQTNAVSTNAAEPVEVMTNAPAEGSSAGSNAVAEAVSTNTIEPAEATAAAATTSSNMPAEAMPTNAAAATTNATEQAVPAEASTNAAPAAAASIPLIQFQDVPLTTAIENLARQAGINYLLDPKIGYGQPDANGRVKPEPTLSIRWENITAEHALLALLENYGLQLIPDPKTQISRITIKDPTAPPPLITRVIQLKYSSVSNMTGAVESVLTDKRSRVLPDSRTSQLVVVATDPEQASVDTLINQLDKPTRQVLIETRLVEISSTPQSQKGVDWSGTLQAQNVAFGNGSVSGTYTYNSAPGTETSGTHTTTVQQNTVNSIITSTIGSGGLGLSTASGLLPDVGFLNADGLHAVLSFLNSSSDAQVMSTPRIVTLDNEMATIEVTRGYPVFNVTAGSANSSGGSSVNYSNVGTILRVTPRISANDYIWLKVQPEVSSFFGNFSQTVGGGGSTGTPGGGTQTLTAPVFDSRSFDTQVLVPNANTLVMGGLVKDNPQSTTTKVPILGDIPILGYAFRSEDKTLDKDNLLVFITPTIVRDKDFQPADSAAAFLQSNANTKLPQMLNPNSSWDNTKPSWDGLSNKNNKDENKSHNTTDNNSFFN